MNTAAEVVIKKLHDTSMFSGVRAERIGSRFWPVTPPVHLEQSMTRWNGFGRETECLFVLFMAKL